MVASNGPTRASLPHRRWNVCIPYFKPVDCFHGGAFFDAIGTEFKSLERKDAVINADVLDAWFPPSPTVLETLKEHLPWLIKDLSPNQL